MLIMERPDPELGRGGLPGRTLIGSTHRWMQSGPSHSTPNTEHDFFPQPRSGSVWRVCAGWGAAGSRSSQDSRSSANSAGSVDIEPAWNNAPYMDRDSSRGYPAYEEHGSRYESRVRSDVSNFHYPDSNIQYRPRQATPPLVSPPQQRAVTDTHFALPAHHRQESSSSGFSSGQSFDSRYSGDSRLMTNQTQYSLNQSSAKPPISSRPRADYNSRTSLIPDPLYPPKSECVQTTQGDSRSSIEQPIEQSKSNGRTRNMRNSKSAVELRSGVNYGSKKGLGTSVGSDDVPQVRKRRGGGRSDKRKSHMRSSLPPESTAFRGSTESSRPPRYDSLRKLEPGNLPPDEEHLGAPWYQAGVPREVVLELLGQEEIGSFIVRDSGTHPGCYALSVKVPKFDNPAGISHYLIMRTSRGGYRLKGLEKEWSSLTALVTHHTVMPEMLPCTLRLPRKASNFGFRDCDRDDKDEDDDYQRLSDFSHMMHDLKL